MKIPREKFGFDPSCFELAETFLEDSVISAERILVITPRLAQAIQDMIEDFISAEENRAASR